MAPLAQDLAILGTEYKEGLSCGVTRIHMYDPCVCVCVHMEAMILLWVSCLWHWTTHVFF